MVALLAAVAALAVAVIVWRFTKWVIAYERSLYDDTGCPPGRTNYPGPM